MPSKSLSVISIVAILAAIALGVGAWFYHQQSIVLKANTEELKQTKQALDQSVQQARDQTQALNDAVKSNEESQKEQAARSKRVNVLASGLNAANSVKLAMAEGYMTNLKWPDSNKEAGVPVPQSFKTDSIVSITVQPKAKIKITTTSPEGKSEQLWLTGSVNEAMQVLWKCTTEDIVDIAQLIPACSYSGK